MVNRNQGSGTRILIDDLLQGHHPNGYAVQSRSHNAVAASVAQRRSDWGVAIHQVVAQQGLGFLAIRAEEYDFVIRPQRMRPGLTVFRDILNDPSVRDREGIRVIESDSSFC